MAGVLTPWMQDPSARSINMGMVGPDGTTEEQRRTVGEVNLMNQPQPEPEPLPPLQQAMEQPYQYYQMKDTPPMEVPQAAPQQAQSSWQMPSIDPIMMMRAGAGMAKSGVTGAGTAVADHMQLQDEIKYKRQRDTIGDEKDRTKTDLQSQLTSAKVSALQAKATAKGGVKTVIRHPGGNATIIYADGTPEHITHEEAERFSYQQEENKNARAQLAVDAGVAKAGQKEPPATVLKQEADLDGQITASVKTENLVDGILGQINSKELEISTPQMIQSKLFGFLGISGEGDAAYAAYEAQLESMRNAVLQANTGVQTDGDAVRAANELIKYKHDPKVVIKSLATIKDRMAHYRGLAQAQRNNLSVQYRGQSLQFDPKTGYAYPVEKQPVAAPQIGSAGAAPAPQAPPQAAPSTPTAPTAPAQPTVPTPRVGPNPQSKAKTKMVPFQGKQVEATLEADGKYYIRMNGKVYRSK